jgi:hypothetical protein
VAVAAVAAVAVAALAVAAMAVAAAAVACSSHTPQDPSFRPKQSRFHRELRSGEICFSTSTAPQPTVAHLHLLLQVPAVILALSVVEWGRIPEEFHSPKPLKLSTHPLPPLQLVVLLYPAKIDRHFDRQRQATGTARASKGKRSNGKRKEAAMGCLFSIDVECRQA